MLQPEMSLLSLTELEQRFMAHPLKTYEIPIGHYISLPLPTQRWHSPAFARFASPARRGPTIPTDVAPPDRWWVLSARSGGLLVYALMAAIPYADDRQWHSVTLPVPTLSIDELREQRAALHELLDTVSGSFFASEPGSAALRSQLLTMLHESLTEPLLVWHQALVPDFFTWLAEGRA
jgi:hypothetical protein